jgi:hypothetical protein
LFATFATNRLYLHHFSHQKAAAAAVVGEKEEKKTFCEHLKVVAENRFIYTNLTQ